MSYGEQLFCVSFDQRGMFNNPLPIGRTLTTAKELTRYDAWAQIQDYFGQPYQVSYAQVNVIPGKDPDTTEKRRLVERSVRGALRRYGGLMQGKGGTHRIPIKFSPEEIREE